MSARMPLAHTQTDAQVSCTSLPSLAPVSSSLSHLLDCSLFPHTHPAGEGSDSTGLDLPNRGHLCSPSARLVAPVWQAALTQAPRPPAPRAPQLFPLSGPLLGSLPIHLLGWYRYLGTSMLVWARDRAVSRGAGVTGPKASHESPAGNSRFLLLVLHFLAVVPHLPSSSSAHPDPTGPLNLTVSGSQPCPGPAVVALTFESGLVSRGETLLFWPREKYPDLWATARAVALPGTFTCLCTLLGHLPTAPCGISLSFYKTYPAWREAPSAPFVLSRLQPLTSVRAGGQCRLSTAGPGAVGFH